LSSVLQQVVRAIGVAFAALLLNLAVTMRGGHAGMLTMTDFRIAFLATAAMAMASVYWYYPMARDTGAHVSGHRPARAPVPEEAGAAD
jgi:hypothetical protein